MTYFANSFSTRNAVIPCETGVFANARDGHRLSYDCNTMKWTLYSGDKSKFVKKHTLKPYYIVNRYICCGKFHFEVYCATDLTKKGLNWKKIYEAEFTPFSKEYTEKGEKSLSYWLFGDGKHLIQNCLVNVLNDDDCIKECVKYLWNFNTVEILFLLSQIHSFEHFIKWWMGDNDFVHNNAEAFKNRAFGIEIEFTGVTRYRAARVIAKEFNSVVERHSTKKVNYKVEDSRGRIWKVICDASIESVNTNGSPASESYKCELVSPICDYSDIETIQRIVRGLREIGMKVNDSCGIHIHVDFDEMNASGIRNLINLMGYCENVLYSQLNVPFARQDRWCRCTDEELISYINKKRTLYSKNIMNKWYDDLPGRVNFHYDSSRYSALNLHSLWQGKGIEFRVFNSTTHAGKIKAYIQFCLAISEYACSGNELILNNSYHKATFEEFAMLMDIIGLKGNEFKTARIHLLNEKKTNKKTERAA